MNFEEFKNKVNKLDYLSENGLKKFEIELNLTPIDLSSFVLNDRFDELDINKLPYVIDVLYRSNNDTNFMLCDILLDLMCMKLPFITHLENYRITPSRFKKIKSTLVKVFAMTDGLISNCMGLIIVINDPKFKCLDKFDLDILVNNTKRKLEELVKYIDTFNDIDDMVLRELEVLIDLACFMNKNKDRINRLVSKLSKFELNYSCKLFITKYKIANNMNITKKEIKYLLGNSYELSRVASVFSKVNGLKYLEYEGIDQEDIALSTMERWIIHHNKLMRKPNSISLIDTLEYKNEVFYIYKFKLSFLSKRGYMLGVSGGYKKDTLSSSSNLTYSLFETIKKDYNAQALSLIEKIDNFVNNK